MMSEEFLFDVYLSHSANDKTAPCDIAKRLRADGLKVWFDEWVVKPGDNVSAKIEEGLERSRVLVLCMSASAFGSDWAQLEAGTFRFRDPLNKDRRFIPLRLDDAPAKGPLGQFCYIDWRPDNREQEYPRLLDACQQSSAGIPRGSAVEVIDLDIQGQVHSIVLTPEGRFAIIGIFPETVQLWALDTKRLLHSYLPEPNNPFRESGYLRKIEISEDGQRCLTFSDATARVWETCSWNCLRSLKHVSNASLSRDGRFVLATSWDSPRNWLRLIDVLSGQYKSWTSHADSHVYDDVALSYDFSMALMWDRLGELDVVRRGTAGKWRALTGHTSSIEVVVWSVDGRHAITGSADNTLRVWDIKGSRCLRVLEGHTNDVSTVALRKDGRFVLSGSKDSTVRLWDLQSGQCIRVLAEHQTGVVNVAWAADGYRAFSADAAGQVRIWDFSADVITTALKSHQEVVLNQTQYTNAKVLLVGDNSVGKTGLSNRLARGVYKETDSTVGAWATHWSVPLPADDAARSNGCLNSESSATGPGVEREIWLWDFGGQADQRLIHQLYMDQTQVAALVFDPQKQDLLDGLGSWDRDLMRAATGEFQKLLVAGRIDTGSLRSISRQQVDDFARERGFARYIETSAKENIGCEELKEAICELIDWNNIAKRTTPKLFRRLKEEIVALKDEGRVLLRFNELRETLTLRMGGVRFTDEELRAVISLLVGPGVVWELGFGSWQLLAPELINAYAQAVIRTIREDDRELGCITEECVLAGKLSYPSELQRLSEEEERILLLGMHRLLVENSLCLSEPTDSGTLLVFPTYARRERPDLIEHPSVLVGYQFEGFVDDIYATLVVRLHRTSPFTTKNLWNDAADFETMTGQKLGVMLSRTAAGMGELLVYFAPGIPIGERMIFSRYVQEHLYKKVKDRDKVKRLRHWVCEKCGEPVKNRERAMQRLNADGAKAKIICVNCEQYVQLWDAMEIAFADPEIMRRVRELEAEADHELDNESKERVLVGDVISTVSLAGQISRELPVSDHGIDMEIEFKNDAGDATGRRLYLQLKSGNSYLTTRKRDGVEIFKIAKQRHVKYWMDQAWPVMLVIRNSEGEIRWMEIRDHLNQITNSGQKLVRQIVFNGERLDVMSVRRWREKALNPKPI